MPRLLVEKRITDDNGSWKDRDDGLHKLMEDYFSNIFSTSGVECEGILAEVQNSEMVAGGN